jgi:hypothetical protein
MTKRREEADVVRRVRVLRELRGAMRRNAPRGYEYVSHTSLPLVPNYRPLRVRHALLSNGIGSPLDDRGNAQMATKHPKHKAPI